MTQADDREAKLIADAKELRDWYRQFGKPAAVTLFSEDYTFLRKRKKIAVTDEGAFLDGEIEVRCGHPKRRKRKKRPPELFA